MTQFYFNGGESLFFKFYCIGSHLSRLANADGHISSENFIIFSSQEFIKWKTGVLQT